jgi:methenyltetrahydrofolate cyclohydrolase
MTVLVDDTLRTFLDSLASAEPTPGGGSAAALAGAIAASLVSMVCNLTLGKRRYRDTTLRLTDVLARAEGCRERLRILAQDDARVYGEVMAAYRLPQVSGEERTLRDQAWQQALTAAAYVPMEIAERCREVVDLALPAAQVGNPWAVSDAGVAAYLAEASLRSALLSVEINVKSIASQAVKQNLSQRSRAVEADLPRSVESVLVTVRERMGA